MRRGTEMVSRGALVSRLYCHWCAKDSTDQSRGMLAHRCFRWIENIPNVLCTNFFLFPVRGPVGESPLPDQPALYHWDKHSITSMLSCCVYSQRPTCSEQTARTATVAVVLKIAVQNPPLCFFFLLMTKLTCLIVLLIRSPAARSLWEAMLTSKHKEGVMEVRRQLVEAASKEKLPIKMSMGKNQIATNETKKGHILFLNVTQIHTK